MASILIHLTHGVDRPTEADRAFLIAQTVLDEGHAVAMFLAGAAVELVTAVELDRPLGFGPALRERFDRIAGRGGDIHVSQMSCELRGVDVEKIDPAVILSSPSALVRLTLANDRVITYG